MGKINIVISKLGAKKDLLFIYSALLCIEESNKRFNPNKPLLPCFLFVMKSFCKNLFIQFSKRDTRRLLAPDWCWVEPVTWYIWSNNSQLPSLLIMLQNMQILIQPVKFICCIKYCLLKPTTSALIVNSRLGYKQTTTQFSIHHSCCSSHLRLKCIF